MLMKPVILCPEDITQATDAGSCSATLDIEAPFVSDIVILMLKLQIPLTIIGYEW